MTIFCNYVENIARSNYYMTLKINNIKDSKFENIYERLLNNKSFIIFVYKMFSFCYKHLAGYFIYFNAQDVKLRLLEYFFGNLKLCWVRTSEMNITGTLPPLLLHDGKIMEPNQFRDNPAN